MGYYDDMDESIIRKRILLLEDYLTLRKGISLALEMHRFEVYQASNGKEGLALLEGISPDLILSDINMPVMNGQDFFRQLRLNPVWMQIPFIFLTGNDPTQDIQAGHELGV